MDFLYPEPTRRMQRTLHRFMDHVLPKLGEYENNVPEARTRRQERVQ